MDSKELPYYSPTEERANVVTHAFGLLLSIFAFIVLIARAYLYGNIWHLISFGIFGASLIILYAASTFYHRAKNEQLKARLNIVDHASIYVLIAGTYTPFALVTLKGPLGWMIFGITWGLALIGMVLKLFFTGKFEIISTISYVLMGWLVIFFIIPLFHNLPLAGMLWLFAGGISYTIGAILFSMNKIKFNHAMFHIFVLMGSYCHFMSIFFYVLIAK